MRQVLKSIGNSTVWILLAILFATVQLQASEITSVSATNPEGRVVLSVEADATPEFKQHIDYAEWMMLVDFPGLSLSPTLTTSSYDFHEDVAEWVRGYRLESTPAGSRLVILLGERATPLRIETDRRGNTLTIAIPTKDEGEDLLTVPLGFMDPPISFWEITAKDGAYRVTPLELQPVPEERVEVAEAAPQPEPDAPTEPGSLPYAEELPSFNIPRGIEQLPPGGEVEGMGEEEKAAVSFSFELASQEDSAKTEYSFEDFAHPVTVSPKAESEPAAETASGSEPEPVIESAPEPETEVASEPESVVETPAPAEPKPAAEPAPEPVAETEISPEPKAEEETSPILEVLTEEELMELTKHPNEAIIRLDEGQYVKESVETQSELAVSGELPPEGKRERSGWMKSDDRPVPPDTPRKYGKYPYPWDVKRQKAPPGPLPEKEWLTLPLLERERITFEWVDGSLSQAISLMVASTSFNVIIDDAVPETNVTLSFRDTPLSEALETLTAANNLSYSVVHNTIIVGNRDDIGRRLGGYITRSFYLNYADAEAVKNVLVSNGLVEEKNVGVYNGEAESMPVRTGGTMLSEGEGGVTAGDIREMTSLISTARRNTLIVTETPEQMEIIAQVVADIDRKPKVVTLESSIVEITEDGLKNLGFELPDTIGTTVREQTPVSSDGIPLGLWLQTLHRDPYSVAWDLQVQIEKGNARILSRPNLTAIDGTQAIYFAGRLVPYISRPAVETGATYTPPEVKFQAVGITLSFKPRVDSEDNITIEVNPSVSTLLEFIDLGQGARAPNTQTRQVTTTVRVENRETFVIAGLLSEEERENLRKIPLLSELPLFGQLFRSTEKTRERTEIMVFVTPVVHE